MMMHRRVYILFILLVATTQAGHAQTEFSFGGGEMSGTSYRFLLTGGGMAIQPHAEAPMRIESLTAGLFIGLMNPPSEPEIPDAFALGQNYPNPFNSSTTIPYSLSQDARVRLELYDVTGRLVATLINQTQPAGQYNLRVDFNDKATGMYLVRLRADGYIATRKLMHIK